MTEHYAPKATAVAYLNMLPIGEMQQLLNRAEPGVPAMPALTAPVVAAVRVAEPLALMPPGGN